MHEVRAPALTWTQFKDVARLSALDAAPAHLRLYAFSTDRLADPIALDAERRDAAVALISATGAATVILAEERFSPEVASDWWASLRTHGHPVAKWLKAPQPLVREFYARDARRRQIAATALASATEGAKQLVELLTTAMQRGASDIDIVVDEDAPLTSIRLRVHGSWILWRSEHDVFGQDLIRAAFSAVKLDERVRSKAAYSPRTDLAGVARFPHLRDLQVRLQQMVERSGFGLSMRLLSYAGLSDRYRTLTDLGYTASQSQAIADALSRATGLVLVVGATGSGKTTALNLAVGTSPRFADRKWVSIEDPPEIDTPGIFQVPVASAGSFGGAGEEAEPFAAAMRRVLRFSPDGVIAGEIRDRDTAQLAVQMALTGHVVAASLHASDAFLALARLTGRDLAVDPGVLQEPGVLSLVVAQRLVPKLCDCALTFARWSSVASPRERHEVERVVSRAGADDRAVRLHNRAGCDACRSGRQGYSGRVVCAQCVEFDSGLLEAWRRSGIEAMRARWSSRGTPDAEPVDSIGAHASLRMSRGECDPRDVATLLDPTNANRCQGSTAKDQSLPVYSS